MGHHEGDILVQKAAESLSVFCTESSEVFRIGGDEFAAVLCDYSVSEINRMLAEWQACLAELNRSGVLCQMAHGIASREMDGRDLSISDLLQKADERMYRNKRVMKRDVAPQDENK